ncbi:MAG: DUF1080 domain-containing protein [Bacteroidales bacterium]|jgi:HEAT repeat protein|nr:DUF1080 domain-containing protein [Bacteroidales bacterium]
MKTYRYFFIILLLLVAVPIANSQDRRTVETKVADILARFPASDLQLADNLTADILLIGEQGLKQICDKIIPPGSGDDTPQRFAVETMSRYLSQKGRETDRKMWESMCISYIEKNSDKNVKDFFMKQLQLIGSAESAKAVAKYLNDKDLCEPAVAVIAVADPSAAEAIFAEALKNQTNCAPAMMNHLAAMGSAIAVNEYIALASSSSDNNIKASAYNALALSGDDRANKILSEAAAAAGYKWELTAATESLLKYAETLGKNGNVKASDKICKLIMSKCNDNLNIHYKTKALEIYTNLHGMGAQKLWKDALKHTSKAYRVSALQISHKAAGNDAVNLWIAHYPKAPVAAKPELISFFGTVKAEPSAQIVTRALFDNDEAVRVEAATAITQISGRESAKWLISYMSQFTGPNDQEAAKSALMTVLDKNSMPELLAVLTQGNNAARKTAIELFGWNGDNQYYRLIAPSASATDKLIKSAAANALQNMVEVNDQESVIELLKTESDLAVIADLQAALAAAALKNTDAAKRSDIILGAIKTSGSDLKVKLIPVLAKTGGKEALQLVTEEFEKGTGTMKDICFTALINWCDYSASSSLYDICTTGEKIYFDRAFDGYMRQIRTASVQDDQKLLLLRKIMDRADNSAKKNRVITETGRLKTYPALFFAAKYVDNVETSAAAARAIMNIALPVSGESDGLKGAIVKNALTKAMPALRGSEADYEREMINKYIASLPADEGFVSMFNGKDLTGWKGLVENPIKRAAMKPADLAKAQVKADEIMRRDWKVENGCLVFDGPGYDNICTIKQYGDFEMYVDWLLDPSGKDADAGIYLRGTPQVQMWDTARVRAGAQVGSGGLYNNRENPSKPLKVADNKLGEWNTMYIKMVGDRVTVMLNGELVTDNVVLENYWDRKLPIFPIEQIELQAHGSKVYYRDLYISEINDREYNLTDEEKAEGFESLFNGKSLDNWIGDKISYVAENGNIVIKPGAGHGGNLFTEKEYSDFIFRFEFQLTPGANNGLGVRAPLTGDAAYAGMELQILDDTAPVYATLEQYQYHGSVYGVIPAKRGYLNPVGEWNYEEVRLEGTKIKITLNGTVIVDGDLAGPRDNGTLDKNDHPGLKNKTGHIGFLGHGSEVKFKNIRIKNLAK